MHKFGHKVLSRDVLIISDVDKTYTSDETIAELKYLDTLKAQIAEYGVKMIFEEVDTEADLIQLLANYDKDKVIIFNWCERLYNREGTEGKPVRIYEELGFTFTGASSEILKLSANKYRSVELLKQHGVPVPDSQLVTKKNIEKIDINLDSDIILKSNALHASASLYKDNVVNDKDKLHKVSNRIFDEVNTSVIAQRFIPGDEFTVVVWGNK